VTPAPDEQEVADSISCRRSGGPSHEALPEHVKADFVEGEVAESRAVEGLRVDVRAFFAA
jgi:hypothetical protein